MSIEGKHAYRFGYLKSEEWQNLRIKKLAQNCGACSICGNQSVSNDAHHVFYRKSFWETRIEDITILCRSCHVFVHEILDMMPRQASHQDALDVFRKIKYAARRWMSAPQIAKHAERKLEQVSKKCCKLCKQINSTTVPRNILEGVIDQKWKFDTWIFCDSCYVIFRNEMRWPIGLDKFWKYIRSAREFIRLKESDKMWVGGDGKNNL